MSIETVSEMNLRVFPAGTVVCTCSCDMGTTAITDRPLVTNQTFIGLVPRSSRIVADFLYYSLQAHRAKLNADATGAIQSYLSRDDFRALRLPLPEPIVQREIASFLDVETGRIDALIDKKQRLARQVERRFAHFERQMALGADAPVVPIRWYIRVSSGQAFPLEVIPFVRRSRRSARSLRPRLNSSTNTARR